MSGLEAAASLFGSDESNADPFASLGADTTPPLPPPSDNPFPTSDTSAWQGTPDLTAVEGIEPSIDAAIQQEHSAYATATYDYHADPYAVSNPYASSTAEPYSNTTGNYTERSYNDYSHTESYQHSEYTPSQHTVMDYSNAQTSAPAAVYDPYAPSSIYSTSSHAPAYSAPSTHPQPSYTPSTYSQLATQTYGAYTPATQSSQYAPQSTHTSQHSTPASYAPQDSYAASLTQPIAQQPSDLSSFSPPVGPQTAAAALNRPKVTNAYDPPFPTTTSGRRVTSGRSAASHQTYSAYNTYQTATTPPPPLPAPPSRGASHPPVHTGLPAEAAYYGSTFRASPEPFRHHPPIRAENQSSIHQELDATHHVPYSSESYQSHNEGRTSAEWIDRYEEPNAIQAVAKHLETGDATEMGPSDAVQALKNPETNSSIVSPPPERSRSAASRKSSLSSARHSPDLSYKPSSRPSSRAARMSPVHATWTNTAEVQPSGLHNGAVVVSGQTPSLPPNSTFMNGAQSSGTQVAKPHNQSPYSRPSSAQSSFDTYAPKGGRTTPAFVERMASPSSHSIRSLNGRQGINPQVPITAKQPPPPPPPDAFSGKSISSSNKSQGSTSAAQDPYAPVVHNKASLRDVDYSNRNTAYSRPFGSAYDDGSSQELSIKPFTLNTAYAPSPSLVGANDTLGRISARAPVFSFGFGGKLVTCFHGAASLSTGFDVALSSRNSTGVTIKVLKDIIPESALGTSSVSFPGPLLGDPGASTSIVRTGTSTQTKTKKAKVVKYLEERIDEISRGLGYVQVGSVEKQKLDGKLVLVKLLKLMVDNDGKLLGTPQLDDAVRSILVPRLEGSSSESSEGTGNIIPAYSRSSDVSQSIYGSVSPNLSDSPISVTTLRPSALDRIEGFLLRGERRKAYHFALDEKLWAHAMVIASSIDKEAWKEVVNEFLKNELALKNDTSTPSSMYGADSSVNVNGRESLRVAYSLFSGQGAAAVQELAPQNLLARANGRLQPAVISTMTPRTPNFATLGASPIPVESLSNWAETIAMMIFSPLTSETSSALTALGDQLIANKWTDAAHACYLLSPQTSIMGGLGNPASRVVLVGSQSPSLYPSFTRDPDPFIFSEIVEFALSLTPTVKGQEPFIGLPHLQAYRFVRAMSLVELGDMQLASRYCEAITASLARGSPYFTPALLEQLKGLSDRINGIHQGDKSGSWIGGKLSKPSLDTIGGWLEGRFTKLVTGDADTPTASESEVSKAEDRPFAGPFSHYSTISSTTPSARSSPQPTTVNLNVFPPPRTGSALSSSPYAPSAASDYAKPALSPNPYGVSAAYPQSPSVAHGFSNYTGNNYSPSEELMTPKPSNESNDEDDNAQEASWWGATYTDSSSTKTPTTATFMKVDEGVPASSDGFISLMDNHNFSVGPSSTRGETPHSTSQDDDDDLGLGNPKKEKREAQQEGEKEKTTPAAESTPKPSAPARPELKPTSGSSGSWFSLSRLWKRDEALTPGPVKASLGEESAFYYDKELKRWINKKAGAETATKPAAPPPPPSRAQTASPGMTGPRAPPPSSNGSNPTRSASAIDLSTSPPSNKPVMRVRSNLVPPPESAPSTPTGTRLAPPGPPPGRPKSQASKRNIRNRYVDVFSQENGGA